MDRTALSDGNGWFDCDRAIMFREQTRWDGKNRISVATGSQWDHEFLYYTASGNWVLNATSQWQGSVDTYSLISDAEAGVWLVANECLADNEFAKLPAAMQQAIQETLDSLEV